MPPRGDRPGANDGRPVYRLGRAFKIGTFHIGSSIGDLLTSALWNRVMIVDLGVVAWPVASLTALRYFLAPLSLWAGHRSDTRPVFGSRRLAYIWFGRLLMLLSLPLLPLSLVAVARSITAPLGWVLAFVSFTIYGVGTLISGAPFLALVHDSVPYEKRGQAISIVQFMLVVSFAFIPAAFAALMPVYEPARFMRLVLISMLVAAFFWFTSVIGEERHGARFEPVESVPSLRETLRAIWADTRTRRYAAFLSASAFFAFMQDAVLEPFGGDVFGLAIGETTRFNAYWGAGVLVAMVATMAITRRWRPEQQVSTTAWGLSLFGLPMFSLGLVSLTGALRWVAPALVLFGLGFGVFTVGGVSLLMAMSREERAGSYLALWTVIQLVSRGAGIAAGGVVRDLALSLGGDFPSAYAVVFALEAVGALGSIVLLRRVDVAGFVDTPLEHDALQALAGAD